MTDPRDTLISLPNHPQYMEAYHDVLSQLPDDFVSKLNEALISYLCAEGDEEVYRRMNGQTVGQVIDEYKLLSPQKIVAQGELNGASYMLSEPQSGEEEKDQPR